MQGFLYDNEDALNGPESISETLHDMIEIGHLELDPTQLEDNERALAELQEFLRVAVQLLFEQLQPLTPSTIHPPSSAIN